MLTARAPVLAASVVSLVQSGRPEELPQSLTQVAEPVQARYLLTRRLPETAREFLEANPEHPRARLERYLWVSYPPGTDEAAVVAAMREDPFVEYAFFSSSPGGDDGSEPPPSPGDDTWGNFEMQPIFHIGKPRTAVENDLEHPNDYEHQLAIGVNELNFYLSGGQGYRLLGRQGFVAAPTKAGKSCANVGLVTLKRYVGPGAGGLADYVVLPETYVINNHVHTYQQLPAPLGCVVPVQDSDNDGLPDAFEVILGTNPSLQDSDGDSCPDGSEYPLNSVPRSDPAQWSGACS